MSVLKMLGATLLILLSNFAYSATNQDDVLGFWLSESGKGVVEIYKKGDKYEGKIVWVKDIHDGKVKEKLDVKNPDEKLQSQSLMGLRNLHGFSFKKTKWEGGKVYDPAKGKIYSSYLYMLDNNTLKLRGYIGVALFGRTSTMIRQKSSVPDSYAK